MKYEIRDAVPLDAKIIASFNTSIAEETEGHSPVPDVLGRGVMNILRDSRKGRYWVAESNGEVVGQIMVTYEWSDWRNGTLWWIQSVYVHPDHRRHGVFSSLYHYVESAARENDACGLRLYVKHDNKRAQDTYAALGMVNTNYQVMQTIFGETKC